MPQSKLLVVPLLCLAVALLAAPGTVAERATAGKADPGAAGKGKPAPAKAEPKKLKDLIAGLDDDDFQERERASRELHSLVERLGEATRGPLEVALKSGPSPEQRSRLQRALALLNRMRAERLKALEAKAELHAVGLHEPSDKWGAGNEVAVKVTLRGKPVLLALCASKSVRWKIEEAPGAQVVKVLVGGHHRQHVAGVDVPVEYYVAEQGANPDQVFYAYRTAEKPYEEMVSRLRRLTGKGLSSFQGQYCYDGRPFIVSPPKPAGRPPADAELHVVGLHSAGRFRLDFGDVTNMPGFCDRLREEGPRPAPSPAGRVWQRLPESARAMLREVGSKPAAPQVLMGGHLSRDLKGLLPGRADRAGALQRASEVYRALQAMQEDREFYEEKAFKGVSLTGEGRELLKRRAALSRLELLRLNRLLLEAAFPGLIRPTPQGAGTATVRVRRAGKPTVLVLTAYESVRWLVEAEPGARLHHVLVGGYYQQEVKGVQVPVVYRTYMFPDRTEDRASSFYAYLPAGQQHDDMVAKLRKRTGLGVTSFQGMEDYPGKPIVIGGKR